MTMMIHHPSIVFFNTLLLLFLAVTNVSSFSVASALFSSKQSQVIYKNQDRHASSSSSSCTALCSTTPPKSFSENHKRSSSSRVDTTTTNHNNNNNNNSNNNNNNKHVVYQKVVRPPPGTHPVLFLGHLVEYLQDKFEFPDRLPMIYERKAVDDDNDNDNNSSSSSPHSVITTWDSPLSPSSDHTCLYVQVVGIFPRKQPTTKESSSDNKDSSPSSSSNDNVPNMAMVIVEKKKKSQHNFAPMMQGLFADSEKKIFQKLDRGLEDFMAGKFKFDMEEPSRRRQDPKEAEEWLLAELMDEEDDNDEYQDDSKENIGQPAKEEQSYAQTSTAVKNSIDATVISKNGLKTDAGQGFAKSSRPNKEQRQQRKVAVAATAAAAALKTMQPKENDKQVQKTPMDTSGLEFAIEAAKQAVAKRNERKQQDFAVEAAKQVAAKVSTTKVSATAGDDDDDDNGNKKKKTHSTDIHRQKDISSTQKEVVLDENMLKNIKSPMLDPNNAKRSFMTTVSTPQQYNQKSKSAKKSQTATKSLNAKKSTPTETKKAEISSNPIAPERKLNLKVENQKDVVIPQVPESLDVPPYDDEIAKAAMDALSEMAEAGKDMTPEEILADVMKFEKNQYDGDDKKSGTGFASGAFEKAKDLLREQKQFRQENPMPQTQKESVQDSNSNNNNNNNNAKARVKEMTPEEELRSMFEAGQRLAETRIELANKQSTTGSSIAQKETREEDIDAIIDSDKSVSRHARILDDELAELEVRINRSPDENLDGPEKNPLFDIFSGPEVYDRNVDPETAVNWPGARPGTKEIRLPKELDEALKQAKFAAEVLMSIDENNGSASESSPKVYKVGNRELTEQQLQNLKSVVLEAVEIGLIDNPLDIAEEKARLQMILDELRDQPEERFRDIVSNYKDLLLSDYIVPLIKNRLKTMADRDLEALRRDDTSLESVHKRERELLGQLVVYAQLLLKEARALGAELEVQQIEVIRSICKVAMDPSHQTEEETAMALSDAVRDMRPLLDEAFVAYLKYAIAEEEGRLARAGLLHDPEYNQWLFVLQIVQQGVYAELAKGINRYIEHIFYVLRMETPIERRLLLDKLINVMPSLDVRPFVQVVENIVASLGDGVRGDFDGITPLGEMTNKLLQLHRDVKELLPPEKIAEKSRVADEWAAKQRERLLEQRNLTKQRLKAAQDTQHLDSEIEAFGKRGEVDRFD